MGLREWIIAMGVVMILAIAADAIRRLRRQRQNSLGSQRQRGRLNAGQTRGDRSRERLQVAVKPAPAEASKPSQTASTEAAPAPEFHKSDGQRIPMLLDAVTPEPKVTEPTPRSDQFVLNLPESPDTEDTLWPQWDEPLVIGGGDAPTASSQAEPSAAGVNSADAGVEAPALPSWEDPAVEVRNPQDAALSDQLLAEPEEVLVMTVLAGAEESFDGPSLLQLMLACGLRFGHMNIFHASDAHGALQYSVANAFKPGTFDLDALDQLSTRGVTFFLQLPCQAEPLEALSAMQHSATLLAETLGGTLLDDQRHIMSAQTLTHYHERVREFQRARLKPRS